MSRLVDLVPFDPEDSTHVQELIRQRVLCGWNVDAVEGWCAKVRSGLKGLQWIVRGTTPDAVAFFAEPLPSVELCAGGEVGPPSPDPSFAPIGHVSLDWYDDAGEKELASKDDGIVTISTFFILKSQQGRGLGNAVMDELEALAGTSTFGAKTITLNTLDGDQATDTARWVNLPGGFNPSARFNERWYLRRGYKTFRRAVPRYKEKGIDGSDLFLDAVYMRKEVVAA
ncbi:hypothetical protein BCR35DRAFT_308103 [Leucosporidium creatinivorum]|uniref:N-acetyltransferase domain-containing protein n=1 Tax=Leucosporidium creatinivorum TaxID=106004 RepID=A0A1Y2ECJ9_9BASI|nr:hypothetical protein BCR35DRAFT_308103 [Leucosporidium creatinivorum]